MARDFPFVRFLRLGDSSSWLLTMNARTLIEMHRTSPPVTLAGEVVAELDRKKVCPVLSSVAFGGGTAAG